MPVYYHQGKFPPTDSLDWGQLIPWLTPTAVAIARYDGLLGVLPNPSVLLSPLSTQEAVLSSKIEGTQATIGEVLEFEAGKESAHGDIEEVLNYRQALRTAQNLLDTLPLSQRLIKKAHAVLMSGVRGATKAPGEYRKNANWIGPPGCTVDNAHFVPIGADGLPQAMSDWEKYLHDSPHDVLVQLAIIHAEFEAIHPFWDGNGRLGRMLIPLYMWKKSIICQPMFYISQYFEEHREEYYQRLRAVSAENDWTGWCLFFLKALKAQAENNLRKAEQVFSLYDEIKKNQAEKLRSQYFINAVDWIFSQPVFNTTAFIEKSKIPAPTARRLLAELMRLGVLEILREGRGRRVSVYHFPQLLTLVDPNYRMGKSS